MVEKKELLRGTIEELADYFHNELSVVKYSEDFFKNIQKDIKNIEASANLSIQKQLLDISLSPKSFGMVCYLNVKESENDEIKMEFKADFVFIVDKNQEEKD